jgi:hypothetical protein
MKPGSTMTLLGLAAIGVDCAFVASIFALLLLNRHSGVGIALDILFVLLLGYGTLLLLYGRKVHQFMTDLYRDNLPAAGNRARSTPPRETLDRSR